MILLINLIVDFLFLKNVINGCQPTNKFGAASTLATVSVGLI